MTYHELLADAERRAGIARLEGVFIGAMLGLALALIAASLPRAFIASLGLPF